MSTDMLPARLALKERNQGAAELCASELQRLGFEVIRVSERGVSFAGPVRLFESVFVTKVIEAGSEHRFSSNPALPAALADAADSIYFPTKPTFFQ